MFASSSNRCILAFALFVLGSQAFAQNSQGPDYIVPARPTVSNPAEFQRPGVLQLETGYNGNFRADNSFRSQSDIPLALRFAVSRRILVELDLDSPSSFVDTVKHRTTGAGDTQFGIQVVAEHENRTRPGVAFAYYIKVPTASAAKGLGTGRVDHEFVGLVSKTYDRTTIDFNAIWLLAGRTSSPRDASSAQGAIAVTQALNRKWGVQAEISGAARNDESRAAMFGLEVVTYQVNRRLVFDSGVREGLTADAPHVGLVAGLTVGIADLYKKHH